MLLIIQIEDYILSSAGDFAKIKIMNAKLRVHIVTLSAKDNVNLTKQLSDGLKRSDLFIGTAIRLFLQKNRENIYELLSTSFQGVERLFVFAYFVAAVANADEEAGIKDNKKYFLLRGEINNYSVLIDGINF